MSIPNYFQLISQAGQGQGSALGNALQYAGTLQRIQSAKAEQAYRQSALQQAAQAMQIRQQQANTAQQLADLKVKQLSQGNAITPYQQAELDIQREGQRLRGAQEQRLEKQLGLADKKSDPTYQYQSAEAKAFAPAYQNIISSGLDAADGVRKVDRALQFSNKFLGGNFDKMKTFGANVLSSFGVTPQSLVNRDAYDKAINQIVVDMIGQVKRPSQLMESILQGTKPFANLSQDSRQVVLNDIKSDFRQKQRLAANAIAYRKNHGKFDSGFYEDQNNQSLGAENPLAVPQNESQITQAPQQTHSPENRYGLTQDQIDYLKKNNPQIAKKYGY